MERIDPRDLALGHDEACAADLLAVVESRMLGRVETSWLARAVAGAIRPSRDRPLWDLAHAAAALDLDWKGLVDLVLDPTLATPAALQDRLGGHPAADTRGLTLGEPRPWRCSWTGLARVFALAEFLLTAEECAHFAEITAMIGTDAPDLARALSSRLAAYRRDHMPLAPIEQMFRAIRGFLRDRGLREGFGDGDILAFWQGGVGGDVMFTTVVDHFITYRRAESELGALSAIGGADALDAMENWEARLEAAVLPLADATALQAALAVLADMEDGPKLLTRAEHDALSAILSLDPFHRLMPLTALRALAFGRIQSGIANRLRRGSGGAEVAERVLCGEADYAAQVETATMLAAHLRRCLTIALALRTGDEGGPLAAEGERELKRMRRAGFDAPRAALAASIALVDGALATSAEALEAHRGALAKLDRAEPLSDRLTRDRATFAEVFGRLYLDRAGVAP